MALFDGLPKSIRIGPWDIAISVKKKVCSGDSWGEYNHGLSIVLKEDQPNGAFAVDTLIHELLHGIYRNAGTDHMTSEEQLVTSFATGLTQIFRDSPELIEWLGASLRRTND